jgi:hypothetical protein
MNSQNTPTTKKPLPTPTQEQAGQHPLIRILLDYDNCPDDAIDVAAELVAKLLEIHTAAGEGDWNGFMEKRSIDWFDEVAEILSPFEENVDNNHSHL